MKQNIGHFIFNSDYPIEMITYFKQVHDVIRAGATTYTKVIPHNLGYVPLVFGVFSNDKDFNTTLSFGSGFALTTPDVYAYEDRIEIRADSTEFLPIVTEDTDFYYRIYAFAPDDHVGFSETTQQSSKPLIMDTDYAYSHKLASLTIQPGNYEDGSKEINYVVNTTNGFRQEKIIAGSVDIDYDSTIRATCMCWVDLGDGKGLRLNTRNDFDYYAGSIAFPSETPTISMKDGQISVFMASQTIEEAKKVKIYVRVYADG